MEKVAEHINEMQRIHEEYGAIFDHLFRQHQKSSKQVNIQRKFELKMCHLYLHVVHHPPSFIFGPFKILLKRGFFSQLISPPETCFTTEALNG